MGGGGYYAGHYAGGIAGGRCGEYGTVNITGCHSTGNIGGGGDYAGHYAGGIAVAGVVSMEQLI